MFKICRDRIAFDRARRCAGCEIGSKGAGGPRGEQVAVAAPQRGPDQRVAQRHPRRWHKQRRNRRGLDGGEAGENNARGWRYASHAASPPGAGHGRAGAGVTGRSTP
jgi:hypothetical protein